MLKRARNRLESDRVTFAVADLTRLPYASGCFDAVVCGWVLEHLPDPRDGLRELARVMKPGGKLLLMCTEDTLTGAMCSRMWHCRTHNRASLQRAGGGVRPRLAARTLVLADASAVPAGRHHRRTARRTGGANND